MLLLGSAPGLPFSATVADRPGALALLFADLDTGPPVTLGDLPLPIGLTGSSVLMSLGMTDAAGSVTLPAAVPADPLFHHCALYLQAVVGQPVPLRYGVSAVRAVLTNRPPGTLAPSHRVPVGPSSSRQSAMTWMARRSLTSPPAGAGGG